MANYQNLARIQPQVYSNKRCPHRQNKQHKLNFYFRND